MLLTFERRVVQLYLALPHFLAEDQIATDVEESQDTNGFSMTARKSLLADEKTEVRIRKLSILGHPSRLTRILHFEVYRR